MKMRRIAVGAIAAALFAAPAFASMADVDTDGDKMASFDELRMIYTDLYEAQFDEIDANGDKLVDDTELATALKDGLLVGNDE